MVVQITSTAFAEGEMIPKQYTCDGADISPPLSWTGVPASAKSLALISDDPDAPMGTWVHWVLYNIPPDTSGLMIRFWAVPDMVRLISGGSVTAVPARPEALIGISSSCMRLT